MASSQQKARARTWRRLWLAKDIIPVVDWDESDEPEEDARITLTLDYLDEKLAAYGRQCQREALEAACKAQCVYCESGVPYIHDAGLMGDYHRSNAGNHHCMARPIRSLLADLNTEAEAGTPEEG